MSLTNDVAEVVEKLRRATIAAVSEQMPEHKTGNIREALRRAANMQFIRRIEGAHPLEYEPGAGHLPRGAVPVPPGPPACSVWDYAQRLGA